MGDRAYGADVFTQQAGNIAGPVDGNSIKGADESGFLGADGHTDAAVDAGIPAYDKNNRFFFGHRMSDFLVFGMRAEVAGHSLIEERVPLADVVLTENIGFDVV